ncbi:Surfactin synthase subunit 2 [Symmachiella macrocystis]|uniref:Surfactin synthase subunit 2 n=1 Tax=Symmachiella macrocystis TaxID=2527985 RepID=A0A5C6BA15_9PLAN|nr:amino acid adenylation domain-containing protein [Symmachiella macrocystis]TWU08820.1 Surfactin synthase subunit 2 [Symmachiella macrocystis]
MRYHLLTSFCASLREFSTKAALEVCSESYSYERLDQFAGRIAATIATQNDPTRVAGLLAARSLVAYSGVLGILRSGKAYVPLNPRFPQERTLKMIDASGMRTIVVGSEAVSLLKQLLPGVSRPLTLVLADTVDVGELTNEFPLHKFVSESAMSSVQLPAVPDDVGDDDIAYLLFTSGSTGDPKGVPVSHRNVVSYLRYLTKRYGVNEQDRFSQTFDLTFDLSVHDMFLCWSNGGCLCCVPERSTMAPAKFIREKQITMWFSVPSVASFLQRLRLLEPGAFPTIRYSLFCGEPLLASSAKAWQAAAPNSVVENLYGPTEATIAISHFPWNPETADSANFTNGVVPIGTLFTGQSHAIIDAEYQPVSSGQQGELCLSGTQVTRGYLNNDAKTAEQFIHLGSSDELWYRTGDLVREDETGCIHYLGRIDNQIQVLGHRVELQEIENALRQSGDNSAVALGWPPMQAAAECIYAVFTENPELETQRILSHCKQSLPDYMVPRRVIFVPQIPLNANGKVDRRTLSEQIRGLVDE